MIDFEHIPVRVLLVEDHEDTREGYAAYLRLAGLHVDTAGNGLEAVQKTRRLQPDIVVMDLMMPKMDGWDAIRLLKADERTRFIPVIALTAQIVDGGEDARARAAGFDRFCRKPCPPSRLIETLQDVLRASRASLASA